MADLHQRLYTTKLTLLALVLILVGITLMALDAQLPNSGLLSRIPVADVGSALVTTGVIGVLLMHLDAKDAEERASARLRRVLKDEAPAIRDAVIDGFAASPEALRSVTSPEVLDRVVRNSLGLQLQDATMATELHEDLLKAAMDPSARYFDSRLSVRLSAAPDHASMLRLTMHREYRLHGPPPPVARFRYVETDAQYQEALRDAETTEVYRHTAGSSLAASDPACFQVLDVSLDGEPQVIGRARRSAGSQIAVRLLAADQAQHHLAFTYEVLIPRTSQYRYFDFGRPTLGLEFELDVAPSAGLGSVRLLDFLGGPDRVRRQSRDDDVAGGNYSLGYDGWVLPPAGVVAMWRSR